MFLGSSACCSEQRARVRARWGMGLLTIVLCWVSHHCLVPVAAHDARVWAVVTFYNLCGAFLHRLHALPAAPRICWLLARAVAHACQPAVSQLGQPHEGILAIAALAFGELVDHPGC